jgi:hypothetical protein
MKMKEAIIYDQKLGVCNKCFVCKGEVEMIRKCKYNGNTVYYVGCLDCEDCRTAEYERKSEAVKAWKEKILF